MDEAEFSSPRHTVDPHDHAVFVYDEDTDILTPLDAFIREGVERKEVSAFVHSLDPPDEADALIVRAHADASSLRELGRLILDHYKNTFEGDGDAIDYAHVDNVLGTLMDAATTQGHKGMRIFVDASREYLEAGREDEWFAFEEWLGPRLKGRCGLVCAYRRQDLKRPGVLARVLETHAYRFGTSPAEA